MLHLEKVKAGFADPFDLPKVLDREFRRPAVTLMAFDDVEHAGLLVWWNGDEADEHHRADANQQDYIFCVDVRHSDHPPAHMYAGENEHAYHEAVERDVEDAFADGAMSGGQQTGSRQGKAEV